MTRGLRASGRRALPLVAAALVLGLTGCASTVDSIERLGRKAAERVGPRDGRPAPPVDRAAVVPPHAPEPAPPHRYATATGE
ncbi:hypothetical protein ACFV14_07480 [Streptomyces zaomyceticus]|uniref:hypothetical protein n=1 Tax=Streptomyces zaomyceticus TaxID=68286 RepID=UPI00368683ED